jgi:hypothetical protein
MIVDQQKQLNSYKLSHFLVLTCSKIKFEIRKEFLQFK